MTYLIHKLTWAIVESEMQKPNMQCIQEVLKIALEEAIKNEHSQKQIKNAFIRTAKVIGA